MATEKTPNYTEAQETRMASFEVITPEIAEQLAAEFEKDVRSVRAKASRMGIYQRKAVTSKSGAPIEKKIDIVADIAAIVNANLDGLEDAPKEALRAVRDYVRSVAA